MPSFPFWTASAVSSTSTSKTATPAMRGWRWALRAGVLIAVGGFVIAAPAGAEIRFWVDEKGVTNFTDDPDAVIPEANDGASDLDTLRGAWFACQQLIAAQSCGDPTRLVRALVNEALYLANEGVGNADDLDALMAQGRELARRRVSARPSQARP